MFQKLALCLLLVGLTVGYGFTIALAFSKPKVVSKQEIHVGRYNCHTACFQQRAAFESGGDDSGVTKTSKELDLTVASKFKLLTCSGKKCAKARKKLKMGEYSTYSAFWTRANENAPSVTVEESPCLGPCKKAPCVAVEHEDYAGTVALEGMTKSELSDSVFHYVVTDEDANRVWKSVENAIHIEAGREKEEEKDGDQQKFGLRKSAPEINGEDSVVATTLLVEGNEKSFVKKDLDPVVASQFKILTCSSKACAKARKKMKMDEYSTFSAFWTRAKENAPTLIVEESPCLGPCKKAPCVAVEHEDYEGTVALEGMTESEFSDRVFHNVVTEEDASRVWTAVENAIHLMAEQENEEEVDDDLENHDNFV